MVENSAKSKQPTLALRHYLQEKSLWTMLFLGFSAGLPILLIFGTLGVWLNEAGVSKSTITYFSWAGLGYGFKFVWAPLIDQARLPILTRLIGKRRSWLLVCQLLLLTILIAMAMTDPAKGSHGLLTMALLAVALGFGSASQDIVIDAYRIEITPPELLGLSASAYILGYRAGMIIASTFALILSEKMGSALGNYHYGAWQTAYLAMAIFMLVGIVTTLIMREPQKERAALDSSGSKQLIVLFLALIIPFVLTYTWWHPIVSSITGWPESLKGLNPIEKFLYALSRFAVAAFVCFSVAYFLIKARFIAVNIATKAYWQPVKEFINRYPPKLVLLILLLVGFYRISDIVLGVVAYIFYQDIGFSKEEIGYISKVFGLIITLLGSFLGGGLIARYGTMKILFIGAVLSALTNLLFAGLANFSELSASQTPVHEASHLMIGLLMLVISADNLSAGIANIAFIAFLSRLSNIEFTAMQYALFSSLMTLFPHLIGGYSGTIVEMSSYQTFFIITTVIGIPVMVLVWWVGKHLTLKEDRA